MELICTHVHRIGSLAYLDVEVQLPLDKMSGNTVMILLR